MGVADPTVDGEVTAAVMTLGGPRGGALSASLPPSRRGGWKANDYISLPRSISIWNKLHQFDPLG